MNDSRRSATTLFLTLTAASLLTACTASDTTASNSHAASASGSHLATVTCSHLTVTTASAKAGHTRIVGMAATTGTGSISITTAHPGQFITAQSGNVNVANWEAQPSTGTVHTTPALTMTATQVADAISGGTTDIGYDGPVYPTNQGSPYGTVSITVQGPTVTTLTTAPVVVTLTGTCENAPDDPKPIAVEGTASLYSNGNIAAWPCPTDTNVAKANNGPQITAWCRALTH